MSMFKNVLRVVVVLGVAPLGSGCSDDGSDSSGTGGTVSTGGTSSQATGGRLGIPQAGSGAATPSTGGANASSGGRANTGGAPSATGGTEQAGSVGTGGTPPEPSGSPTLVSLSPEEQAALCRSAQERFESAGVYAKLDDATCRLGGAFTALLLGELSSDQEVQELCQESYDDCVVEPEERPDCAAAMTTCTATVDEFNACLEAYPELVDALDEAFPECSELTVDSLETVVSQEPPAPSACTALWEKCPDQDSF